MVKYLAFVLAASFFFSNCFADTFTHIQTGESFNGYATQIKKRNETRVYIEGKSKPQYLDLSDYEIQRNYLGRKDKVYVFPIKDPINLICETEAFERAVDVAANQGPFFILIEIDTLGGRMDLDRRICAAIAKVDNCSTVAFVSGGKFGGAFSGGATMALACDKVYMRQGAAIGAAAPYVQISSNDEATEGAYGQAVGVKFNSAWSAYCASLAERNSRPGLLARAMVDEDIEVIEVLEDGKRFFISPKDKKPTQSVVRTWSEKDSLLTLTSAEAVQSGMADKIATSLEELFTDLDAKKVKQVRETGVLKARSAFERDKKRFDKILIDIDYFEKRAASLVREVRQADSLSRYGTITRRYRGGGWRSTRWGNGVYGEDSVTIREHLTDIDQLVTEWLGALYKLRKNYKKALPLAKKHPDLHYLTEDLEKGLRFAKLDYDDILRNRPVW